MTYYCTALLAYKPHKKNPSILPTGIIAKQTVRVEDLLMFHSYFLWWNRSTESRTCIKLPNASAYIHRFACSPVCQLQQHVRRTKCGSMLNSTLGYALTCNFIRKISTVVAVDSRTQRKDEHRKNAMVVFTLQWSANVAALFSDIIQGRSKCIGHTYYARQAIASGFCRRCAVCTAASASLCKITKLMQTNREIDSVSERNNKNRIEPQHHSNIISP